VFLIVHKNRQHTKKQWQRVSFFSYQFFCKPKESYAAGVSPSIKLPLCHSLQRSELY
jgi:hypothetical protein